MGETEDEHMVKVNQLFENFVQMSTCKGTLQAFSILCRELELDPLDYSNFYSELKAAVNSWKVKALWTKLDKRAQQKVYSQKKACQGTRCLIIGGGPCGLRTAIELALLGCKVVVIEKRDTFSRNNVLHLWPFTIEDLRGLGAKKFYGKFCAGSIDHISIRQLQLMLLKICLILGIEVHVNVEFIKLVEPPDEQTNESPGWRADIEPSTHSISDLGFDVMIGADGRKNTLDGFSRKEFRGKLAIAITANFVNRNTTAEAKVEEISGVAFIFNQKFFLELKEETGIDLENIVYYRDNTHYFVMTAKKQSLLDKGVINNDYVETERLLRTDNVNQEALLSYAREAADFGTNYQLPSLDYAINHYGQPDVAMFDFTSMYASENAALIREKHGHQLLVALVGDSLLEPFWPMGTGCARGFLAAFDTAWMVKAFAEGKNPLELLAERESIYRLLPQTTTENISKNFDQYTIDPATRYPNLNSSRVRPHQVRHLFIDGKQDSSHLEGHIGKPVNISRGESEVRPDRLLTWCQRQTNGYRGVNITNMTSCWRSGLALCALIHRQRPELIDYNSLNEDEVATNNQLAFDVAEHHLGIQPVTTGKEIAAEAEPDKLLMVLYLSKFYEAFRNSPGNKKGTKERDENSEKQSAKGNLGQPRKRIPKYETKMDDDSVNKRRRKGSCYLTELSCHGAPSGGDDRELRENKVRSMATQLLAKFEENSGDKKHGKPEVDLTSPSFSSPLSSSSTLLSHAKEEGCENPRFVKPKYDLPPPPPTLCSQRPKWQPSVYLRLLENPASMAPQNNSHISPTSSYPPSPSNSLLYSSSPELPYQDCTSPVPQASHFSGSALLDNVLSSPRLEEEMKQSKTGRLSSRQFAQKTIKERAVLLSSLFTGSNKPTPHFFSLPEAQVEISTSLPPISPSKSSKTYPVVHPVPDPTAHAGFSSNPVHNKHKKEFPFRSLNADPESLQRACHLDSLSINSKVLTEISGSHESRDTTSPLPEISFSSDPVFAGTEYNPQDSLESKQINKTAHETAENHKCNRNTKCNGSNGLRDPKEDVRKSVVSAVSFPRGSPSYCKERTVGKVSSTIDAKAQILAILYETDHRPGAAMCVSRKECQSGFGGSDICHFCSKRVYIMERLSAEGYFFHRECFRCDVCNCTLRLGGYTFSSYEAKFYCKMHYTQYQSSTHFRKRKEDHSCVTSLVLDNGRNSVTSGIQIQPSDSSSNIHSEDLNRCLMGDPEGGREGETDMAVETLGVSCLENSPQHQVTGLKGHCKTKHSDCWKQRIKATFPLIFVKHFQRSSPRNKEGPETVPEVESDFEDIDSSEKQTTSKGHTSVDSKDPSDARRNHPQHPTCNSTSPKRRLILSLDQKENVLSWDTQEQVQAKTEADKPHADFSQHGEQTESQFASASSLSAFQLIANAFRRTFSVTSSSSSSNTAPTMKPRHQGQRRQRPMSEGELILNTSEPESSKDNKAGNSETGLNLPSLLQQVSQKGRRDSGTVFNDHAPSLPSRKVTLFSSLRLRKREPSESDRKDQELQKEIRMILANIRKKASGQQSLEEPCSTDDECESTNKTMSTERQQMKQEKMVALQAKQDQLKRLHRAQAIQRQLEEVGEKQRDLEERGVAIEKVIRGETGTSNQTNDGDHGQLYQCWFELVMEKNRLARYESDVMIFAQELELEETQGRLQRDLRRRMSKEDTKKSASELQKEQEILSEIMRTVEKRDMLVSILEEQRLMERAEDRDLESLVLSKGYEFHWAQANDSWGSDEVGLRADC
ncbi:F-actin-monooxygenase mical2b isoform X5 [Syngnathoides biaculeatus]|uniref:F-actin-monooxygenase mical2b isoform X5 n=1 Tax=Syngnathoides biaculeatus TaxID=300417 RepID=UPI002ADE1E06|nr:F-actin-monooxygenase mical2b isoform X5 [Syngnathoides biaculeatus]